MKKRKRKFSHLDAYQRDRIEALLSRNHSQKEIAEILKVDKSTISREIRKRKTEGIYNSGKAQAKVNVKRNSSKYQGMKIEKQ